MKLFVDDELKSGPPGQYIPRTEMMYLGGVPAGFERIASDGFNPVILNSLKGGSIQYLTSKGEYVFDCIITIYIMQTTTTSAAVNYKTTAFGTEVSMLDRYTPYLVPLHPCTYPVVKMTVRAPRT